MIQHVAQKFKATDKRAMVIGGGITAMLDNLRTSDVEHLIVKHNFQTLDANTWYPQQTLLNVHQEIEAQYGYHSEALVAIGVKTIDTVEFPTNVQTVEQALTALTGMYAALHRNIPADEGWSMRKTGEQTLEVTFSSPYSDTTAYGYLYSIARRFAPKNMDFSVRVLGRADEKTPSRFEIAFSPR